MVDRLAISLTVSTCYSSVNLNASHRFNYFLIGLGQIIRFVVEKPPSSFTCYRCTGWSSVHFASVVVISIWELLSVINLFNVLWFALPLTKHQEEH